MNPKPKHPGGRPPKLTLPIMIAVGEKIAKGMTEEQACLLLDVNHNSFVTAKKRNPQFELAIKREQAKFVDVALNAVRSGRDWVGYAWILERRHKPQFNRTDTAIVASVSAGGLSVEDAKELERMAKELYVKGGKE